MCRRSNPTIWALCALSRPHELPRVMHEFEQQTYPNKMIAIIENKDGIGACERFGIVPDLLLHSEPHQAIAKNAGLNAIRDLADSGDWWATWDDDDCNGPGRLAELAESIGHTDVLGKSSFFMRMRDGRLLKFTRPYRRLWGSTLSAKLGIEVEFRNTGRWGEDEDWLCRVERLGFKIGTLSPWHFIVNRSMRNHAWCVSDDNAINCIAGGRPDVVVQDYGNVSADFALFGCDEPPSKPLAVAEYDWELSLAEARSA